VLDVRLAFHHRDLSLLILGETGTGKEVLARAIHDSSKRANNAFMAVNCAAIAESLIESELFGYVSGTFTGGRAKGAKGLIQQASGGTLFLDEIGDIHQLCNTLTFAEAICETDEITVHNLPEECAMDRRKSVSLSMPLEADTPEHLGVSIPESDVPFLEKQDLLETLRQHRWNISAVAKQSNISRPTLYRRIKKHKIILPKDMLN
jgi:transcriptional regulator with PAS, ATPase and Fis domain